VGHYKQDVSVYRVMAQQWRELRAASVEGVAAELEDINQSSGGGGRGLHSFTFQLNLSSF
jgi:hypothetical protein